MSLEQRFIRALRLDAEQGKDWYNLFVQTINHALFYPLKSARILIYLGYEPFPLSVGRTWIFVGRETLFLPNLISYTYQLAKMHGIGVLYAGIDSSLFAFVIRSLAIHAASKYINKNHPEIGGSDEFDGKEEDDLNDHESFRRMIRKTIRSSCVFTFAAACCRPFEVVSLRQIAQIIGGEQKYLSTFQGLILIGNEEGPAGYFSGLIPILVGCVASYWMFALTGYIADRTYVNFGLCEWAKKGDEQKEGMQLLRNFVQSVYTYPIAPFENRYKVISTVMAVAGCGVAASLLPNGHAFPNWMTCYDYLKPHGLKRGSTIFLREHFGDVSRVTDQKLCSSTAF